jgi:hypothetical protein
MRADGTVPLISWIGFFSKEHAVSRAALRRSPDLEMYRFIVIME